MLNFRASTSQVPTETKLLQWPLSVSMSIQCQDHWLARIPWYVQHPPIQEYKHLAHRLYLQGKRLFSQVVILHVSKRLFIQFHVGKGCHTLNRAISSMLTLRRTGRKFLYLQLGARNAIVLHTISTMKDFRLSKLACEIDLIKLSGLYSKAANYMFHLSCDLLLLSVF